jgi:hypothetical protein
MESADSVHVFRLGVSNQCDLCTALKTLKFLPS